MTQPDLCPLCALAARPLATDLVHQDGTVLALLAPEPAVPGHIIVFPKRHLPDLAASDDATVAALFAAARKVERKLRLSALTPAGTTWLLADGVSAGQPEPFPGGRHLCLHLLPRQAGDGLGLVPPSGPPLPAEEVARLARDIRAELKLDWVGERAPKLAKPVKP